MKFPLYMLFVALPMAAANAAECTANVAGGVSQFVEKYSGGCKDGMAHGEGQLAISVVNPTTKEQMVAKISGTFVNGSLNGIGKYAYSNGTWIVGKFRDGKTIDLTRVLLDKDGVRVGYVMQEGKQVALCRQDIRQPTCTPELNRLLASESPPESVVIAAAAKLQSEAQSSQSPQHENSKNSSGGKQSDMDFFRDLGMGKPNPTTVVEGNSIKSPFSNSEIAGACDSQVKNMSIGYRGGLEIFKIEVLTPVKPAQSGLPAMAIPQTDLLYPTKIYVHFKNGDARQYTQVFIYKSPFGIKCMGAL